MGLRDFPSAICEQQYRTLYRHRRSVLSPLALPGVIKFTHGSSIALAIGAPMQAAIEDTLYAAKVDMVFSGHVHAYERSCRVYRYKCVADAPYYITIGSNDSSKLWSIENFFIAKKRKQHRDNSISFLAQNFKSPTRNLS